MRKLTTDSGLRYRILSHVGIIELFGARAPRLADVIDVFDAVLADPAFRSGFGFLYDRRELEPMAPELIRVMVNRLGRKQGLAGCRLALVVGETEEADTFHLTGVSGGGLLMLLTFHDADKARRWLALIGTR